MTKRNRSQADVAGAGPAAAETTEAPQAPQETQGSAPQGRRQFPRFEEDSLQPLLYAGEANLCRSLQSLGDQIHVQIQINMGEHHVSGGSPVGSGVGKEEILPVGDFGKILTVIQVRHGLLSERNRDGYRLSVIGYWLWGMGYGSIRCTDYNS